MTQQTATATLFERIGGEPGLRGIVNDVVDAHYQHPLIRKRFEQYRKEDVKDSAYRFFAQGTGGPAEYTGKGLREVHKGMNINEQEFVAACDDLMMVLNARGVPERETQELVTAFFVMKDEVLRQ